MSLITRCPTCETMFRVVPDQLRVSDGWVRCGQCAEIFDASQNMLAPVGPVVDHKSDPPPRQAPPCAAPSTHVAPDAVNAHANVSDDHAAIQTKPLQTQPTPDPEPVEPLKPQAPERVVLTAPGVTEPVWVDAPLTDPQTALIDAPRRVAIGGEDSAQARPDDPHVALQMEQPAAGTQQLSFLRSDRTPSFWQRRATRIVLLLLLLALLATLAAQVLLSQRNRIAALEPATQPLLLAMCAWQGCTLSPLRQIESIVIDSSSFSRIRGDDYRLAFSLKNNAPIKIAMPAIELALTDPQDQPVIRRVIQPAEFGAVSGALSGASVWSGTLALNVKPGTQAERIAGYRLLAFYP